MPIYEYLCEGCGQRFEVKQKMSDPPVLCCVHCGKAVTKVISSPAIMFKGSGWYVTDYSDKLKPPAQSDAAKPASEGNKESATAADSSKAAPSPAPSSPKGDSGSGGGSSSAPASPAS